MKEQLISIETARLAKEKGFNVPTKARYSCATWHDNQFHIFKNGIGKCKNDEEDSISAPTQALLQKWLRKKHGIHINIDFGLQWGFQLIPIGWSGEPFSENFIDGKNWLSYEEALENGLLTALQLL